MQSRACLAPNVGRHRTRPLGPSLSGDRDCECEPGIEPCPSPLLARFRPPYASTSSFDIRSPRPVLSVRPSRRRNRYGTGWHNLRCDHRSHQGRACFAPRSGPSRESINSRTRVSLTAYSPEPSPPALSPHTGGRRILQVIAEVAVRGNRAELPVLIRVWQERLCRRPHLVRRLVQDLEPEMLDGFGVPPRKWRSGPLPWLCCGLSRLSIPEVYVPDVSTVVPPLAFGGQYYSRARFRIRSRTVVIQGDAEPLADVGEPCRIDFP